MAVQKRSADEANLTSGDKVQNTGELHLSHRAVNVGFNLTKETVYLGTAGAGGITGTLPLAANNLGKTYFVKKIDAAAGTITVARAGADTIDGAVSAVVTNRWDVIGLFSDGANWYLISQS